MCLLLLASQTISRHFIKSRPIRHLELPQQFNIHMVNVQMRPDGAQPYFGSDIITVLGLKKINFRMILAENLIAFRVKFENFTAHKKVYCSCRLFFLKKYQNDSKYSVCLVFLSPIAWTN